MAECNDWNLANMFHSAIYHSFNISYFFLYSLGESPV